MKLIVRNTHEGLKADANHEHAGTSELRRRTRVAGMSPNEASLLRLVTAILVELSDDWETGMRDLAI